MTYEESLLLTTDVWNDLSDEKKIEVLQTIENHIAFECERLPCPVEGRFLHTGTEGVVLGTYDPKEGKIYINSSQFDSQSMYGKDSSQLVTTCLHEGRHAYQHQVVNGVASHDDAAQVEQWRENLREGNYISFRENPRGYYEQPVEADARAFAEERYQELVAERFEAIIDHSDAYEQCRNTFDEQMTCSESVQCDYQDSVSENYAAAEDEGIHM